MHNDVETHDVQWTAEKVARFWDDFSSRSADTYFSAMVAPSLADWIRRNARPGRRLVVDLGCGSGHLLAEMAKRGYRPMGVDSSRASLKEAAERIGHQNVREGSVTHIPLDASSATGLLLVETIEHVLDNDLEPMMREIRRVLGIGWPLVITTPNAENLEAAKIMCPDCAARFHPMQHVRSWTAQSLTTFLKAHGFGDVKTFETRLPERRRGLPAFVQRAAFRLSDDRRHLLAIARSEQ